MAITDSPIEPEVELASPASIGRAIAGDQPDIAPPEDPIIELPRGIFHDGAWQTKVELHELTGEDEERFTRFKDDELFRNVLVSGVDRIGTIDVSDMPLAEQESVVNSLLIGEQMMLLINIIRVTFGNEREFVWVCRNCQSSNTTTLLMSEDFIPKIPDDIRERHEFVDSKGNKVGYVPVSGVHLMDLKQGMSQGAINSVILEKVINDINGDIPHEAASFVRQMGLRDRRALLDAVDKAQPEIDMSLTIPCAVCGEEQMTALSWADLFRI